MYVAVKGGERAIDAAHAWLAEERRGDPTVPELSVDQIREQMALAVDRVMAEGSLYDPDLAALAIKQARGDLIEAVFLIRAYRTIAAAHRGEITAEVTSARPLDDNQIAALKTQLGARVAGIFDRPEPHVPAGLAEEARRTAQALGADACLLGRPHVYGLALDGAAGVGHRYGSEQSGPPQPMRN